MRIVAVAAVCIALSGCIVGDLGPIDRYRVDFHYTYPVDAKARIDAESFNGPIAIEGWDRNEVEISGSKYASTEEASKAITIDVHNTPDSVEIRAIRPASHVGNMGANFTIHVPRTAELDRISTSNAKIDIQDVARAAHLKTSNSSLKITGVSGEVDAHTSNGSIDAESLDGPAILKTSNGHIHAEKIGGSLDAETSNSGIEVRLDPGAPVKLITSNGPIDLTLEKSPRSDIRAETKNNSITLHMPADASAKLIADTSNASVTSDFAVDGGEKKNHLNGTVGSGGHTVELTTSNGRIRIAKGRAK
jgi:DUF4097 and DUF4098 domain-containing protein YvlB